MVAGSASRRASRESSAGRPADECSAIQEIVTVAVAQMRQLNELHKPMPRRSLVLPSAIAEVPPGHESRAADEAGQVPGIRQFGGRGLRAMRDAAGPLAGVWNTLSSWPKQPRPHALHNREV